MDFDDWIRGQLRAESAGTPPAGSPPVPRFRAGRRLRLGLQLAAVVVAAAAIGVGLSSRLDGPAVELAQLRAAPALPADTWAGSPPPPPLTAQPSVGTPAATPSTGPSAPAAGASQPPAPANDEHHESPQPASPTPSARPSPASAPATFNLVGGSATISCATGAPRLILATPQRGFTVEIGTEDGGATLDVRFRSDTHESRLDAWCAGGTVQSRVEESSS